jgi:hypothetical protein
VPEPPEEPPPLLLLLLLLLEEPPLELEDVDVPVLHAHNATTPPANSTTRNRCMTRPPPEKSGP